MVSIQSAYKQTISSSLASEALGPPMTTDRWLARFKRQWQLEPLPGNDLLAALSHCNQRAISLNVNRIKGHWVPRRYHPADGTLSLCRPDGRANEPFYDQFVTRSCQRLPVNLLSPRIPIKALEQVHSSCLRRPAGFIAHLSRCGSTWVSGSMAELDRSAVISESPALTEFLLDAQLSEGERQQLLPRLADFHVPGGSATSRPVVKWNAWDLCHWHTVQAAFPDTPVLLIIRHPLEILASHRRQTGRHMSGDPTLASLGPTFRPDHSRNLWELRLRVLRLLMEHMIDICGNENTEVIDYSQISPVTMRDFARHFGFRASKQEMARVHERSAYCAKHPERKFIPDSSMKREGFSSREIEDVERELMPLYCRLMSQTSH
ncbi:hypothetical protein EDC38_2140 [Marinimicrobium koreense]|uniref:Sulfotransferase family protein n=1 Tax=Marinimicrobium koreense TaxID=306545 RepID=A0A3N1PA03_9GAMM|nr:hypothetical protein [Marinimicrobium koreense]ROQ21516.1 hypothetical protein EDC38_2140 [Marinimicrobium koreense]